MIKHVIRFTYQTGENPRQKNNTVIMEFDKLMNPFSTELKLAVRQKLIDCHNLLVQKFPQMNFGMPILIAIEEVKIISQTKNENKNEKIN